MADNKKYTFKKILVIAVWLLLGSGIVVLLVAAITRKNNNEIFDIQISITGVQNNYFIDKNDVIKILEKVNGKSLKKANTGSLDLAKMEMVLLKDQWINKAEMFFDNNNVLQIRITEREPVARVFTSSGASFYMDSSLTRLPLSDKFSARLPVFTNFPTDVMVLKKRDSILLKEIKILSEFIGNHPFWMAQIDQIDITPQKTFELIPKLGNQVIRFGNADNFEEKFNKLLAFYKQVQIRAGWNRYSVVDVQFKDQVVAVNRDAKEIKMDSLRAIQIMKNIITEAQKRTSDFTNIQLTQPEENRNINNSSEIEDLPNENAVEIKPAVEKFNESGSVTPLHVPEKPVLKNPEPVVKPPASRPSSNEKPDPARIKKAEVKTGMKIPDVKKSEGIKPEGKKTEDKNKPVPKAVMPPKN